MVKILLVEDDQALLEALSYHLTKAGHIVDMAFDGENGKNKLIQNAYDIVISDIQMPKLNGLDLLDWSKKQFTTPFIIMTGFLNAIESNRYYDLGAEMFISKPFKVSEILTLINKISNK